MNSIVLDFPNGLFDYIQTCIFSRLKLLSNIHVKRTVHKQDFGAKFNLAYHNGAHVWDILNCENMSCIHIKC